MPTSGPLNLLWLQSVLCFQIFRINSYLYYFFLSSFPLCPSLSWVGGLFLWVLLLQCVCSDCMC